MTDNEELYVEYEILLIEVTETDVDANTVTGLANPNQEVEVYVDTSGEGDSYNEYPRLFVNADVNGEWTYVFTQTIDENDDILLESTVQAMENWYKPLTQILESTAELIDHSVLSK